MREKVETILKSPDMAAADDPATPVSCSSTDPLSMAVGGLTPDGGMPAVFASEPLSVIIAGPDDLDLSGLEGGGRDWNGFSVDRSFKEDTTMITVLDGDDLVRETAVPAVGKPLTRRDLIADLLRTIVSNLNANQALSDGDRQRQRNQVQALVGAMMNSVAVPESGQTAEAMAEETAKLLMETMTLACRRLSRGAKKAA